MPPLGAHQIASCTLPQGARSLPAPYHLMEPDNLPASNLREPIARQHPATLRTACSLLTQPPQQESIARLLRDIRSTSVPTLVVVTPSWLTVHPTGHLARAP